MCSHIATHPLQTRSNLKLRDVNKYLLKNQIKDMDMTTTKTSIIYMHYCLFLTKIAGLKNENDKW